MNKKLNKRRLERNVYHSKGTRCFLFIYNRKSEFKVFQFNLEYLCRVKQYLWRFEGTSEYTYALTGRGRGKTSLPRVILGVEGMSGRVQHRDSNSENCLLDNLNFIS
jgi:hypothetical protein